MYKLEVKWSDASVRTSTIFGIFICGIMLITVGFLFGIKGIAIGLGLCLPAFSIAFIFCPTITMIKYKSTFEKMMSWPLCKYTLNLCSECNQMKPMLYWPVDTVCMDCRDKKRFVADRGGGIS